MIIHNSHMEYFRNPFGAVPTGARIRLRVAVGKSVEPRGVTLRLWAGGKETLLDMEPDGRRAGSLASAEKGIRISAAAEKGSHISAAADGRVWDRIAAEERTGDNAADDRREWDNAADDRRVWDNAAFERRILESDATEKHEWAGASSADIRAWEDASAESRAWEGATTEERACDYAAYYVDYDVGETPALVWYYFIIRDKDGKSLYYGNNPEMLGGLGLTCGEAPWSYQITVYDRDFHVPGWLRHGIIYQIFPDRFYQKRAKPMTQAEIELKRADYIYHSDWREMPIYEPDPRTGEIMNNDFFGGNIAGIVDKLPYLADLGINIIYLNPIFEAYSNHRYDTGDFMKIDSLLGTNQEFASLCTQARKHGIRVILDGVFNHTGSDSIYFNKDGYYKGLGAYQSLKSKYGNWFMFDTYPYNYKCWWGILTLPTTNKTDPGFLDYILESDDSVIKHWLRQGASGWRLDVVDELPDEFVKKLRKHVKDTDPDAAVIGEVWEDASNKVSYGVQREYFQGYELDSVMNYVFKNMLIDYVTGRITAARFDAEMLKLRENYPKECYYSLMNLIGGHDVARILTILSDPPANMTRTQKAMHKSTITKYHVAIKRLKIMSLIQMTFPGTPTVYYGDEAGMTGFEDPFNRGTFQWDDINPEIYEWYRQIISLRNENAALRTGDITAAYKSDSVYSYIREISGGADVFGDAAEDGFAIVAVNRDIERREAVEIDLRGRNIRELRNIFKRGAEPETGGGKIRFMIEPLGYRLFIGK